MAALKIIDRSTDSLTPAESCSDKAHVLVGPALAAAPCREAAGRLEQGGRAAVTRPKHGSACHLAGIC